MDGETTHVRTAPLDLAAVQSAADLDAQASEAVTKSPRTQDRPGGSVERRDQPVSGRFDERASVTSELPLGDPIVRVEDVPIAEFGGPLGRPDDVGEQDC